MKIAAIALALFLCASAWAKPHKGRQYQDAVLVGFKDVAGGSKCDSNSTIKASTDDHGGTSGTVSSQTDCANRTVRQYTVQLGNNTLVIVYGYNFLNLHNELVKQLPGAHLTVCAEKNILYVRFGEREVKYNIVEAR